MRLLFTAGIAACLALAACGPREEKKEEAAPAPSNPSAPVAPAGFAHDPGFDAAGYYRPSNNIIINNHQLDHIAVGAPSDFAGWEKGEREGVFGPIWLEFNDVRSPRETNELGAEVHTVRLRVTPQAYALSSNAIAFKGSDPTLGEVVFEGRFDEPTFAEAHKSGSSGNQKVMIGALKLGTNTIVGQGFTYWAGD